MAEGKVWQRVKYGRGVKYGRAWWQISILICRGVVANQYTDLPGRGGCFCKSTDLQAQVHLVRPRLVRPRLVWPRSPPQHHSRINLEVLPY